MADILEQLRLRPEHILIARLGDIRPGIHLEKSLEHQAADEIERLRVVLSNICDRTSERMRTKPELQNAMDAIGSLAADALVKEPDHD